MSGEIGPTLQDIGFRVIPGKDTHSVTHTGINPSVEKLSLNLSEDRFHNPEQYLKNVSKVALLPEKRKTAVSQITEAITLASQTDETYLLDTLNYVQSVIGNFDNPAALRLVFRRAMNDSMQESFAKAYDFLGRRLSDNDLANAANCAVLLAQELYSQENGKAYQTLEQRKETEEARARAAKLNIHG